MIATRIINSIIQPDYSYDTEKLSCKCKIYEYGKLDKMLSSGIMIVNKKYNTLKLQMNIKDFKNVANTSEGKQMLILKADDLPPYYSIVLYDFNNEHARNDIEIFIYKCQLNSNFFISFELYDTFIESEVDIYYEDDKLVTFYEKDFKCDFLNKIL